MESIETDAALQTRQPGELRLVAWNCAGAFHRKIDHLLQLEPDIAIVSEACVPNRLALPHGTTTAWVGRRAHKGLLIVGFGDWTVNWYSDYESRLEWILPVTIDGPARFNLLGVWAMNHRSQFHFPDRGTPQPLAALGVYADLISDRPTVVAGDFNGSVYWDTPKRPKFAALVSAYRDCGLISAYHAVGAMDFGDEEQPTHWWRDRRIDGPTYHIDYAFVPNSWVQRTHVEIGGFADWVTRAGSDHAPIIVDVDLAKPL